MASAEMDQLLQRERDIQAKLGDQPTDFAAKEAIANVYRAAAAIRRNAEQGVLRDENLSWGAFTALWVLWIWGGMETNALAAECDLSKGTMTGILNTLEKRELVVRHRVEKDRRRMVVELTPAGTTLIERLSPRFNNFETVSSEALTKAELRELASLLRRIIMQVDQEPERQPASDPPVS